MDHSFTCSPDSKTAKLVCWQKPSIRNIQFSGKVRCSAIICLRSDLWMWHNRKKSSYYLDYFRVQRFWTQSAEFERPKRICLNWNTLLWIINSACWWHYGKNLGLSLSELQQVQVKTLTVICCVIPIFIFLSIDIARPIAIFARKA